MENLEKTCEEKVKAYQNKLNPVFDRARKLVEYVLDIKLTLIESEELKGYVMKTLEFDEKDEINFKELEDSRQGRSFYIRPADEAGYIFLNKNYGLQFRHLVDFDIFKGMKRRDKRDFGYDYSKSFKEMQDEMHTRLGY